MSPEPFAPQPDTEFVDELPAGDAPSDGEAPAMALDAFEEAAAVDVADGEPDVAPVDSGETFEGRPVVTLEYELWSKAVAVAPPPATGEWEAVAVDEMLSVNTPTGVVYAMPGDYLVREKGAGTTDFVKLSADEFNEQYNIIG